MNKINQIFTLSSLSVLLVTLERFSPTTKVLLSPFNFLRLHELIQMLFLITITVIVPALLLKEVTQNFKNFKTKEFLLVLIFIIGIYLYSTGNGIHETASFTYNNYCKSNLSLPSNLCPGLFINDYYTGNIFYFAGGFLIVFVLLIFELLRPNQNYHKKDLPVSIINSVIYAFAIFAYAGFDVVFVGLIYSLITLIFSLGLFIKIRRNFLKYPLITYTALTYALGTMAALFVRALPFLK